MKRSNKVQMIRSTIIVSVMALSLIIVIPVKAITWGELDEGRHPNVGAIMRFYPDPEGGGNWWPMCSGTLIKVEGIPNVFFLTAGHCTYGLADPTEIYVSFADDPLDSTTWLNVASIETHSDYGGPRSNPYDVGALILEQPVTGIPPAILPYEGILDDLKEAGLLRQGKEEADFTVVGYGASLDWPPPDIKYEDKRQYAFSEFQALLKSWLRLSQNLATGDGGSCYGDSGGPSFWIDPETEAEILVGITSWGDNPCVATGFNYRVDTADTLDFIALVADAWLGQP